MVYLFKTDMISETCKIITRWWKIDEISFDSILILHFSNIHSMVSAVIKLKTIHKTKNANHTIAPHLTFKFCELKRNMIKKYQNVNGFV